MIPYQELCAALERYSASHGGEAPVHTDQTPLPPPPAAMPTPLLEGPTGEHHLPRAAAEPEDDQTNVGLQPFYDDKSNELDINDVLSDEEVSKH